MKSILIKLIIPLIFIGSLTSIAFAKSAPRKTINLSIQLQSALEYHDSGAYQTQLTRVSQRATNWFLARTSSAHNVKGQRKLAVVFDIDETLLSNYAIIKAFINNYLPAIVQLHNGKDFILKYNNTLQPVAIEPIQTLYNIVKSKNVAIFLITGTRQNKHNRKNTIMKLRQAGYSGWTKLILRPKNYPLSSTALYKAKMRKQITDAGYTIIFNMGDQYSDLKGGFAEKSFKLPNPYYLIP